MRKCFKSKEDLSFKQAFALAKNDYYPRWRTCRYSLLTACLKWIAFACIRDSGKEVLLLVKMMIIISFMWNAQEIVLLFPGVNIKAYSNGQLSQLL
jgi:hypothetical protein